MSANDIIFLNPADVTSSIRDTDTYKKSNRNGPNPNLQFTIIKRMALDALLDFKKQGLTGDGLDLARSQWIDMYKDRWSIYDVPSNDGPPSYYEARFSEDKEGGKRRKRKTQKIRKTQKRKKTSKRRS
jgi:hypothetical protein